MANETINTEKGHWLLAKMGKKVLRPGGKELTVKLVDGLAIEQVDNIVEFAPGVGYTAAMIHGKKPKTYTGVELNVEATHKLRKKFSRKGCVIINKSAAQTGLQDAAYDKVMGEAMLTMQADHRKSEIIKEAHRILKTGGRYAIHELGLKPDNISPEIKKQIQRELAQTIKVNARPLTKTEWIALLEKEGFKVKETYTSPMHLLRPQRVVRDEGILRALRIGFNVMTHAKAKEKIMQMRKVFKKHEAHLTAFAFILEK